MFHFFVHDTHFLIISLIIMFPSWPVCYLCPSPFVNTSFFLFVSQLVTAKDLHYFMFFCMHMIYTFPWHFCNSIFSPVIRCMVLFLFESLSCFYSSITRVVSSVKVAFFFLLSLLHLLSLHQIKLITCSFLHLLT